MYNYHSQEQVQELASTIPPSMVLSLAEELEVNPAVAILHQFRRNDGDDSELTQAVVIVKEREEATR